MNLPDPTLFFTCEAIFGLSIGVMLFASMKAMQRARAERASAMAIRTQALKIIDGDLVRAIGLKLEWMDTQSISTESVALCASLSGARALLERQAK